MEESPAEPPAPTGPGHVPPAMRRGISSSAWLPLTAFAFVLLALVALSVIPAVILRGMSTTTEEITTTLLPAYGGVRDLAFAMEERISSSRGRFLTNDDRYDMRHAEARAAEAAALLEVEAVAPRLGTPAVQHVESLERYMAQRDSLEAHLLRLDAGVEEYREAVPRFDVLRDSMLVQLQGLRQELVDATQARAADQSRRANRQLALSLALGTVALLAAVVVGWFAWSQRQLRREIQRALGEANRQHDLAERRRDELERAAEARVHLLRGITHDVKNPLAAAKGYGELLEAEIKAPLHPEQRPFVAGIQRSIDSALAIITDLLDLARAERGELGAALALDRVETDLRHVARSAADDHRSAAAAAGHRLEVDLPTSPVAAYTDPARVQQVLGNLLSNAIKYTPAPGTIVVRCEIVSDHGTPDASGAWAMLRVNDSGPGIPADQRDAIFDEFTRLEEGGTQRGHGLGLAIARRIARLLNGDLTVHDSDIGGAAFTLRLPVRGEEA